MNPKNQQVFEIERSFRWIMIISGAIFLLFTISSLALPVVTEITPKNFNKTYFLTGIIFIVLSCITIYIFRIVKQLPFSAITIDNDGIWYSYIKKEDGLIPWKSIEDIQERSIGQRLIIISRGVPAMKIEYQLSNFQFLRSIIANKVPISIHNYQSTEYAKNLFYHLLYLISLAGFSLLSFYVGKTNYLLGCLGILVLVIGLGFEYIKSPYRIRISYDEWEIKYPLNSKKVQIKDILDIKLADTVVQGNRHPEVHLTIKSSLKPIKLKGLGIESVKLYKILTQKKSKCHTSAHSLQRTTGDGLRP